MTNAETVTTDTLVLSVHPLSDRFKSAIEAKLNQSPAYVSLSAVKPKGTLKGLRYLFQQTPNSVFVVVEEPEEVVMVPIISLASLFVRAPRRFVINPDQQVRTLTILAILKAALTVLVGSLIAAKNGLVAFIELSWLERTTNAAPKFVKDARIVYLNTNVNFGVRAGGSLGHIAGVVNELHRRGADLLYVATRRFAVIESTVPTKKLEMPPLLGIPMDLFLFGFSQRVYKQLRVLFENGQPAIIYQRMSRGDYTGAKLSKRHNVPFVIEYNGSEAWATRHWGRRMLFERLARKAELVSLRSAQLVVTISEVLADELVGLGIPRLSIVVYPNCVDSTMFDSTRFRQSKLESLRAAHKIPKDAIVLGFIGTFGKWHGVDVLCEAITILARERTEWLDRHKVRFFIVGDGYHGRLVDELAHDEVAGKYVVWPGLIEQEQAPPHLAVMDILLSPHVRNPDGSRFFGSPTKLFEYMSMSRPIIASRLDQIESVLSPGISASNLPSSAPTDGEARLAILTEPGDARELTRAIEFLVERGDWREALARNARREVLEKYQWSHHVSRIIRGMDWVRENTIEGPPRTDLITGLAPSGDAAAEGTLGFGHPKAPHTDLGDTSA